MSELTPRDAQFVDIFSGFFHDLLRAAGITMLPGKAHEKIRQVATKLAASIEWRAEHKAVEVIRVLQKALVGSFEKVQTDMDVLKARIDALEKVIREDTSIRSHFGALPPPGAAYQIGDRADKYENGEKNEDPS